MDPFDRIWENLGGRMGGPLHFRLLLQPAMAIAFAIHAGLRDARTGQAPYFWSIIKVPAHRAVLLRDGWHDVAKVFALAVLLDSVYQFIVFRWVYPFETLFVAFLLACVPYLMVRGTTNRIAVAARQRSRRTHT